MSDDAEALNVDLSDFDAVGVIADVVVSLRVRAIESGESAHGEIEAPPGWHRVVLNVSPTGATALRVRFVDLTVSRAKNVAKALVDGGWQLDEDRDGAARRYPSGVEAITVAFDALAAATVGGSPKDLRRVRVG